MCTNTQQKGDSDDDDDDDNNNVNTAFNFLSDKTYFP
jgi:hypothetical protein